MGRPRKPTALKLLEGTARKDRTNENEPTYEATSGLDAPETLRDEEARRVFVKIRDILESKFVLTEADGFMLAQLANLESAVNEVWKAGDMPAVTALGRLEKFYTEFGMTPASRAKVSSAGEAKKSNPFAELVGG